MKKLFALLLLAAMLVALPAMAESTDVAALLGTPIEEAGAALGLPNTQDQSEGEDGAYLTLYENDDIMLGGHDGVVVDITLFNDVYTLYGVQQGMSVEEAKAALDAQGIAYTDDMLVELGIATIEFKVPGNDKATVSFEIDEDKIIASSVYTEADIYDEADEAADTDEDADETVEELDETAGKHSYGKGARVYTERSVPVRKAPSRSADRLAVIRGGDYAIFRGSVKYDYRGVAWYKVRFDGVTGWVSSRYTHFE